MRTTITLDDDLARKLNDRARQRRASFKQTVNEILRLGLMSESKAGIPGPRFVVEPLDSEFHPGVDRARLNQLVDELDSWERKEEEAGR